jgi:Flp pilus assembly protein TadG
VVCLPLTSHSAPSHAVGGDTCSRRRRICARLRFGGERGQSLVEFALCLPPLFLLVTCFVALGLAFINYSQMTNAANSAATLLSLSRSGVPNTGTSSSPIYDPCAYAVTQVEAAAPSLKPASLTFTLVINGTSYVGTKGNGLTCSTSSLSSGASSVLANAFAKPVTVTLTYPCELMTKFYGTSNYFNCTLNASMSEVVQ